MPHVSPRDHRVRRRILWGLLAGASGLAAAASLLALDVLGPLENAAYDWRVRQFPGRFRAEPRIVLVLIDQQSLDIVARETGRGWPWGRDAHAAILEALRAHHARAAAFDVMFDGPSSDLPEGDEALAAATGVAGMPVIHAMDARVERGRMERRVGESEVGFLVRRALVVPDASALDWDRVNQLVLPIAPIERVAAGVGSIRFQYDPDGPARRVEMLVQHGTRFLPSFPLAIARAVGGGDGLGVDRRGRLHLGARALALDARGRMLVRFLGPPRQAFRSLSAWALIRDYQRILGGEKPAIASDVLAGAIVLIGSNLSEDLKKTPYAGESMPGVELHAHALAGLLAGHAVTPWPRWAAVAISLVLAWAVGLGIVVSGRAGLATFVALLLVLAWAGLAVALFALRGIWAPVAAPVVAVLGTVVCGSLASYSLEGRERRFIRKAFERYLAPAVIEAIVRDPSQLRLGGVRRTLTVFFSDLQGFTTMSEKLEPEQLVAVLNRYLSEMTGIILSEKGTLDKYIGDAIMCFWGAPLPLEDHAHHACAAALDNLARLRALAPEFAAMGAGTLNVRIGLNTGPAVVGNMGSESTFSYTVMGDTVNLASRLEGVNKEYGSHIMAAEATRTAAGPGFLWRELDLLQVKGKNEAVRVYELLCREEGAGEDDRALVALGDEALRLYRGRDFAGAAAVWRKILRLRPDDGPARTMIQRCGLYATAPPPPGWRGEHVMHTK